MKMKFLT